MNKKTRMLLASKPQVPYAFAPPPMRDWPPKRSWLSRLLSMAIRFLILGFIKQMTTVLVIGLLLVYGLPWLLSGGQGGIISDQLRHGVRWGYDLLRVTLSP